jgi:hypothetical protein
MSLVWMFWEIHYCPGALWFTAQIEGTSRISVPLPGDAQGHCPAETLCVGAAITVLPTVEPAIRPKDPENNVREGLLTYIV